MEPLGDLKFAPLFVPLHRRIETLAVSYYLFMFIGAPLLITLFLLYLLFFSSLWWLVILYMAWLIYDYKTPSRGSRQSAWFRRLAVWNCYRDYFPIRLIKTSDLNPEKNYIFGSHPHGVICLGICCAFGSEALNASKKFPGLRFHCCTLKSQFLFPLRREYYMALGAIESSRESISYVLNPKKHKGNVAVIVVGGAAEALNAQPGSYNITLANRKGFVKMALQCGAHLVPVVSFGENDLYSQLSTEAGSTLRMIQEKLKGVFTYSLPFFYGRGVFNYSFGMLPHRRPITIFVGKAIEVDKVEHPTKDQIDELHSKYVTCLLALFEEYKQKCGVTKDTKMNVL